jgi:hypothetical protein
MASSAGCTAARHGVRAYNVDVYALDVSRRPLLILSMRGPVSSTDLAQMKADLEQLVEQGQSFAMVWDIRDTEIPPRAEIMDLLTWTRELRIRYTQVFDEAQPRIPTFTAYHMPSMLGNLLRFFLQMVPSIRGQHIVATSFDEAVAACEAALKRLEFERLPSRNVG